MHFNVHFFYFIIILGSDYMIESLNKIELHCHLDGSVRPQTVSEILGLPLDKVEREMCFKESRKDLNEYLSKFDLPPLNTL